MSTYIYIQAALNGDRDDGQARPGKWIFRIIIPGQPTLPEITGDGVESDTKVEFEESLSQYQALQEAAIAAIESYEDYLDLTNATIITNNQNAVPGIEEAIKTTGIRVRVANKNEFAIFADLLQQLN